MSLTLGTDSYLSLETAAAYFANRLHSQAWTSATDPDRENALRMTTTLVDSLDYHGTRTTPSQPLAWPRRYVIDRDHRKTAKQSR